MAEVETPLDAIEAAEATEQETAQEEALARVRALPASYFDIYMEGAWALFERQQEERVKSALGYLAEIHNEPRIRDYHTILFFPAEDVEAAVARLTSVKWAPRESEVQDLAFRLPRGLPPVESFQITVEEYRSAKRRHEGETKPCPNCNGDGFDPHVDPVAFKNQQEVSAAEADPRSFGAVVYRTLKELDRPIRPGCEVCGTTGRVPASERPAVHELVLRAYRSVRDWDEQRAPDKAERVYAQLLRDEINLIVAGPVPTQRSIEA